MCFCFRNVVYNISVDSLEEQSVSIMPVIACCTGWRCSYGVRVRSDTLYHVMSAAV